MNTLREEIIWRLPKVVSNLVLALIFWITRYIIQVTLNIVSSELMFLLQTALLIIVGIFLVRALFSALTLFDRLTGSILKRFGIKENWSKQRIFKDTLGIVTILLVAAALVPFFSTLSSFELLQQIITYIALGLIFLFVFDIGRIFYRLGEKKANSVADRFSNSINNEEE
jgi:hypothetical protein